MPDVDIAILGGGCAGLSLASRLAGHGLGVRVIEARTSYSNDRTWSFWRTKPHEFDDIVSGRWPAWSVAGDGGVIHRSLSHMPYETISAGAFYARALDRIDDCPDTSVSLGVKVSGLNVTKDLTRVDTTGGGITARTVIDTRPPAHHPDYGQFFVGREIVTDRAAFEPGCAQIMHFRSGFSDGVDFLYLLPFAPDRALVEVTSFAPARPPREILTAWLDSEIAALAPSGHEVLREERGALPMQVGYGARTPAGVFPLGIAGGAARPATGYAFQRIQAQARHASKALIEGRRPQVPKDAAVMTAMDAIFLRVLRAAPERGPALFQCLFGRVPPERLVRFLSGSTAMADRLAVVASLPPAPFLAAAARLT